MSLFTTYMNIPSDTPIVALSDIHADIDALIICLRDCAKVIRKKENQNVIRPNGSEFIPILSIDSTKITEKNIRHESGDQLLEYLLNLNLNEPYNDELYKNNVDLGYEWIGGPTHIVIIGDILDGLRSNTQSQIIETPLKSSLNEYINQYPQIEVKILMFLNKLDELASSTRGRVIKLIGNHEHMNFIAAPNLSNYAFSNNKIYNQEDIDDSDEEHIEGAGVINNKLGNSYFEKKGNIQDNNTQIRKEIYYNNLSRFEYFNIGNPGYELYKERGTGVVLIIDNNIHHIIFCHGALTTNITYEQLNNFNIQINNNTLQEEYKYFKSRYIRHEFDTILGKKDGILWNREMSDDMEINKRFNDNNEYCKDKVNRIITTFCFNGGKKICDKDKVKLILGHCPQNYSTMYDNGRNRTFGSKIYEDEMIIKYDGTIIHQGIADITQDILFGITVECDTMSQGSELPGDNKIIYRVDVASSRGFDQNFIDNIKEDNPPVNGDNMKRFLHSRTPQILYIKEGHVEIIKSKYENTRKSQPRVWLEDTLGVNGLGKINRDSDDEYYKKYIKYKNKYINLRLNYLNSYDAIKQK